MDDKLTRQQLFQTAISQFITERRDTKLNGKEDPVTAAKYDYSTWLADAARRVTQIQAVTHVLKATHPDARGSSLFVEPNTLTPHNLVGSHTLGEHFAMDIVGNAAALDVYKFLKLEVEGRSLLSWLQDDDADLLMALDQDAGRAAEWANAFKGLVRQSMPLASHEKAKQLYWCVDGNPTCDDHFHLLQPLFPSSLVHAVHEEINDARFGERNKAARQARHDGKMHEEIYRDYRELVARKLGGTKPQNISQLNSERGGVNYLLASLPPRWQSTLPKPLYGRDSVFQRFQRFEGVQNQINALCHYLQQDLPSTLPNRQRRIRIERALGRALTAFGLNIRSQVQAGWTRSPKCQLPLDQQVWLDPGRVELAIREGHEAEDLAFQAAAARQEWADGVAKRFAAWLNNLLIQRGFAVGDAEHIHWAKKALEHTRHFSAHRSQEVQHG